MPFPLRLFSFSLFFILSLRASAQPFTPLWPAGQMPNSRGLALPHIEQRQRITQVDTPGFYAFLPAQEEQNGTAVLICPPGGYAKLTYVLGGFQLARWLNTQGVTAFVLIYRLPTAPDLVTRQYGPLQDAQRAMKLIRSQAERWGIDPARLGVMGASAGGHLAAHLGTATRDHASLGDALDAVPFRPTFQVLISPVISMGAHTHRGSRQNLLGPDPSPEQLTEFSLENQVSPQTSPTFLVHAFNDPVVPCQNSLLYYQALLAADVSSTLHIFPQGGHDIGVVQNPGATDLWLDLCAAWLRERGWLEKK